MVRIKTTGMSLAKFNLIGAELDSIKGSMINKMKLSVFAFFTLKKTDHFSYVDTKKACSSPFFFQPRH